METKLVEKTLKDEVQEWLEDVAVDYDNYDKKQPLKELAEHGCQSGIVGGLIYYADTAAFYKKHRGEINEMLKEAMDGTGLNIGELFGDKWDKEDPLALENSNQNLLAWFGFEETARELLADIA